MNPDGPDQVENWNRVKPTSEGEEALLYPLSAIRKTGILELAACRAWEDFGQSTLVVYIGPTRSLVRERVCDWRNKFAQLGAKIAELTGDVDPDLSQSVAADAHLICTTPEKWEVQWRTRRKQVCLYLIDEVHSIGEPERGPLLEAILTRTVVRPLNKKSPPRFVAVSATVANPQEIGKWLGRNVAYKVREFDASSKACPVSTIVKAFPCSANKSSYSFDIGLDFKLPSIIMDYAPRGKSTLVFVSTRNAAVQCAKRLVKSQCWFTSRTLENELSEVQTKLSDSKLIDVVQRGVAFHHAGLNLKDRLLVEESFVKGLIGVLITTSTLATGLNLPAYLVVVRGTTMYNGGTVSEYPSSKVLQMIGRAGRIQFENSGQAVILTQQQHLARYEALLAGKLENVESYLHLDLFRHLNAEIALGNVKNRHECVDWLESTFFFVRAEARSRRAGKMAEFRAFVEALGCAFSRSYMSFDGFSNLISALRGTAPVSEFSPKAFLWQLSTLPDLGNSQIRVGEKSILRKLNSKLSCKVTEKPPEWRASHKAFIMLLSKLESIEIPDSASLRLERISMMKVVKRASRCLYESILILWQQPDLCETIGIHLTFTMAFSISLLAKSCRCETWYDSQFCALQLDEIGPTRAARLVEGGFTSFDSIANAEARMLEIVTQTNPPFGSRLQQQVASKVPRYLLHWDSSDGVPVITAELRNRDTLRQRSSALMLVGDDSDSVLILTRLSHEELHRKNTFELPVNASWTRLHICLIDENIVGVDKEGFMEKPTMDIHSTPDTCGDSSRTAGTPWKAGDSLIRGSMKICGKDGTCNTWLAKVLESRNQEELSDDPLLVPTARAEKIVQEYDLSRSQYRPRRNLPRDATPSSNIGDTTPDSLEEILEQLQGEESQNDDSGLNEGQRSGIEVTIPSLDDRQNAASATASKKTRVSRTTRITKKKTPANYCRKDPRRRCGSVPENSTGAVSTSPGEPPLLRTQAESENVGLDQKSGAENPTDSCTHSSAERERRIRKPSTQPQYVDAKEPDDSDWEVYLSHTDALLKRMLSQ
ncbi:probable ATP-dependent DNA helicase HFM1 [Galendromus occidentalis]|uniref:Probable ATP-dependent DNA helicase HFM1 n=1 Tax=Galendromus occidentalis TaxID=34638 RepID=A0AAJ7WIU5_9ACAR|nr:probable ATP-dependent DNA helicase HFM1 [Galendromus occidentalis]